MRDKAADRFRVVPGHRAVTGESPLWDAARSTIWWIDIQGQLLVGNRVPDGQCVLHPLPSMPGLVAPAQDGRLVLGLEDGLWLFSPEDRQLEPLTMLPEGLAGMRINDGKADRQGRLWFGVLDMTGRGRLGGLWCRAPGGRLAMMRDGPTVPNAIAPAATDDRLYFADTISGRLYSARVRSDPLELSDERCLFQFHGQGRPDGLCLDSEGNLWLALVGGAEIVKLSPDGTVVARVATPLSRPTMPAFCGVDLDLLAVTSQRRLLSYAQLQQEPDAGCLIMGTVEARGVEPFEVQL